MLEECRICTKSGACGCAICHINIGGVPRCHKIIIDSYYKLKCGELRTRAVCPDFLPNHKIPMDVTIDIIEKMKERLNKKSINDGN